MLKTLKAILIVVTVMSAATVLAQPTPTPPAGLGPPPLSDYLKIETAPASPGPSQEVTASLTFSQGDLNRAEISWFFNGEIQKSGVGEKTFKFRTGPMGTVSRISVSVETFEGETVRKELSVRPAEIDLVWNAETYSPPLYRGRALPTQRSNIRVTAIPQIVDARGVSLNPKSLIYRWSENNTVLGNQSGLGKNVLILEGKLITRSREIGVEVETLDGSLKISDRVTIDQSSPLLLVYEDHPLYGIMFNQSLDNVILLGSQEITLAAIPYFFGTLGRDSGKIQYSWTQDNRPVELPLQRSFITFGQSEDTLISGELRIGVRAAHRDNPAQSGSRSIILRLNER